MEQHRKDVEEWKAYATGMQEQLRLEQQLRREECEAHEEGRQKVLALEAELEAAVPAGQKRGRRVSVSRGASPSSVSIATRHSIKHEGESVRPFARL